MTETGGIRDLIPSPRVSAAAGQDTARHPGGPAPASESAAHTEALRAAAEAFEAVFIAEMLRNAGLGKMPRSFNGGAGEAAFAGSLVEEYAKAVARRGGFGLAEHIYRLLAAGARP